MQQTVDVPADMGSSKRKQKPKSALLAKDNGGEQDLAPLETRNSPHIIHQALFDQGMSLVTFRKTVQDQTFHGESLPVVRELFQDCVGLLHCLFVLLHFVVLHNILEEIALFLGKWPTLASLRITIIIVG